MFNLSDYGAFHWYKLFMLLSLEKVELYLYELGCPLAIRQQKLDVMAKEFILEFHALEVQRSYTYWLDTFEAIDEIKNLFDHTYTKLVDILAKDAVNSFCAWGNSLQSNSTMYHSLQIHEDLLCSLAPDARHPTDELPALLPETLDWLRTTLRQHSEKVRNTTLALVALEEAPQNAWETQIIAMLNEHEDPADNAPLLSPFDDLHVLFFAVNALKLIKLIGDQLSEEQLRILENWIEAQPAWTKDQAKPIGWRVRSLAELLQM